MPTICWVKFKEKGRWVAMSVRPSSRQPNLPPSIKFCQVDFAHYILSSGIQYGVSRLRGECPPCPASSITFPDSGLKIAKHQPPPPPQRGLGWRQNGFYRLSKANKTCRSRAGQIAQGGQVGKVEGQVRGNDGLLDHGQAGRVLLRAQVLQDPASITNLHVSIHSTI